MVAFYLTGTIVQFFWLNLGILALEENAQRADPLMKEGLTLIIDGTEPPLVEDLLAGSEDVGRCYVVQWLRYGTGADEETDHQSKKYTSHLHISL